jgi:hypothetical protein
MSEAETLFAALRQSTSDDEVAMLERMVRDAPGIPAGRLGASVNDDVPQRSSRTPSAPQPSLND